jgi:hypothetical protein
VEVLEPPVHWSLTTEKTLGYLPLKIMEPLYRYAALIGG